MKRFAKLAGCVLVCVVSTTTELLADLKGYKDIYEKNLEQIQTDYGAKTAEILTQYGKSLDLIKATVQTQGDLDKTKAVMAEIERFQTEKSIPADLSETTAAELRNLQVRCRKQLSALETEKAGKIVALTTQYDQALDRLQREMTKAGSLDEATGVQIERNRVRNSDAFVSATASVASAGQAASAGKPKAVLSKTLNLDLGKGARMKLTLIPAGKFMMGSLPSDDGRKPEELPQHEVTISRPFYMGVYEVTQDEYETVMGNNPSKNNKGREFPVTNVSWDDAISFCKQASIKTGKNVRLPTEAEWEYACRAGTKTRFSFGGDDADIRKYANYRDCSFVPVGGGRKSEAPSDGHDKNAPVGSFKPNAWGLYDMHGNVAEWCADWYDENYYSKSPSIDPTGPALGDKKVQRGGALFDESVHVRSARRCANTPSKPAYIELVPFCFGFRVVADADTE